MPRLVETRQSTPAPGGAGPARGVLLPAPPQGRFEHSRRLPPDDLLPGIEHLWFVRWDLRLWPPCEQQILPHPNPHIVFEPGRSGIAGIYRGRFTRMLEGASGVIGIKLRPGALRPLLGHPVAAIANRIVPIASVFGPAGTAWQAAMLAIDTRDEDAAIACAAAFLRDHLPAPGPEAAQAARIVAFILHHPEIRTVEQLAQATAMGVRSLQRLFREYVGATPKWVIRRYRLHELAERLKSGAELDGAHLALALGYTDQAHLINDFRSLVGYSPERYRNRLRQARAATPGQDRALKERDNPL